MPFIDQHGNALVGLKSQLDPGTIYPIKICHIYINNIERWENEKYKDYVTHSYITS